MKKFNIIIWLLALIFIVTLSSIIYYHRTGQVSITFFDIGQGDAALIRFRNGQTMLVDCGADKKILAKLGTALRFYDRRIDYLVATHPDIDHYGGCIDVLKRYEIKTIVTNGKEKPGDPYWETFERLRHEEGAVLKIISQPELWTIASTSLEFFSPDSKLPLDAKESDSNNYSIVFRFTDMVNKQSVLFTGDMELPLEQALAKKYCAPSAESCSALRSQILKVGHHGSDSSSGAPFLKAVSPERGIISVGARNRYGHPSRRVLKRLERAKIEILRTDELGDILVR